MPRSCIAKLCICIFSPCILCFHALRIYLCGCISLCCATLWQNIASCCCGCCDCCCCGCERQYTDSDFPPNDKSLGTGDAVEWHRIEELTSGMAAPKGEKMGAGEGGRMQLFEGDIEPSDISQGGLGDCWLMSSMAALAEFPEVIRNVFVTKRYSAYGKYTLRIFDGVRQQWEEVVIDNYIPCHKGTKRTIFASMHNDEMWAVFLEKAVAKFCGSYQNIVGGHTEWALHALTGFPTFVLSRHDANEWRRNNLICEGGKDRRDISLRWTDEKYSLEDFFYILREYDERKSIMCCSSGAGKDTDTNAGGIVQGHAYSLLGAKKVGDRLFVNVRNPWGCGEWNGAWSDSSPEWDKHPDVKKELGYTKADDGAFWMTIQDFADNFRKVTVCVRETGFTDIALDPHENLGCCGICVGCVCGCLSYWCCCQGCKALCCGEEADDTTVEGKRDGCCPCCPRVSKH